MKTQTKSVSFVFANPPDQTEPAPEKGTISFMLLESNSESASEILESPEFEDAAVEFLKQHFCVESGYVVPSKIAEIISS